MRKIALATVILSAFLLPATAGASSFTFTTSGSTTGGGDVSGQADIVTSTSGMTITLTNLTNGDGGLNKIVEVLDGFSFTLDPVVTGLALTGLTLNGTSNQFYLCGVSCVGSTNDPDSTAPNGPLYGWDVTGTTLSAGNGSFKPYGIVNDNIVAEDGIPNDQHNPYLNGPITFTFTFDALQSAPNVTAVTFLWGTTPDSTNGTCTNCPGDTPGTPGDTPGTPSGDTPSNPGGSPVPEPTSMLLLGSGLVVAARSLRRRMTQ